MSGIYKTQIRSDSIVLSDTATNHSALDDTPCFTVWRTISLTTRTNVENPHLMSMSLWLGMISVTAVCGVGM